MSTEILGQLNWLAVIAAAVLYFAVGAVWYMPFSPTGRAWMAAIGFVEHPQGQRPSQAIYLAPLLGYVLVAVVAAMLTRALNVQTLANGLLLGVVLWLGFGLPYWILASIFNPHAKQPGRLIAIQSGYHLIGLLVVGAILGASR
jgi:hypothetical protein